MNGLSTRPKIAIDDESIAKPPYPGPDDESLPDVELSEDKIRIVLDSLFAEFKQKGKPKYNGRP